MIFFFLLVAAVFSFLVYSLAAGMKWHKGAMLLAVFPLLATYFLGIWGLIISALFVAAMFKASSAAP